METVYLFFSDQKSSGPGTLILDSGLWSQLVL